MKEYISAFKFKWYEWLRFCISAVGHPFIFTLMLAMKPHSFSGLQMWSYEATNVYSLNLTLYVFEACVCYLLWTMLRIFIISLIKKDINKKEIALIYTSYDLPSGAIGLFFLSVCFGGMVEMNVVGFLWVWFVIPNLIFSTVVFLVSTFMSFIYKEEENDD